MNYFANENRLKRDSFILTLLFALCVAGVVLSINIIFYFIFVFYNSLFSYIDRAPSNILHLHVYLTVIILVYIFGAYVIRMTMLSMGGASVAEYCGGVELDSANNDYYYKRLKNVVEEMSIAMGIPVPRIYILRYDDNINAFAAGYAHHDAAITVTKGALEKLNRDELQGMIAHEFSHILNYDIRINTRLIALSSSINAIAESVWLLDPNNYDNIYACLLIPFAPLTILLLPVGFIGSSRSR